MNSSNSSDSSEGSGNTKQTPPSKRWCFTLNNWSQDEYDKLLCSISSDKYVIGKELGEQGTPHLQGYIEFDTKIRLTGLRKLLPRAHWEKSKGKRDDNYKYCTKDGDYIQNFKEEVYIEPISDKLLCVKKLMDEYEFPKGDRKINVFVDEIGGIGKTEFCRYAVVNYKDCIITGGKAADMKNQIVDYHKQNDRYPKYILIDIPRSSTGFISWTGIEEVKNMLFYSGKYEGGMVVGNKPFMCLFTNEMIDIGMMSLDRWNILNCE